MCRVSRVLEAGFAMVLGLVLAPPLLADSTIVAEVAGLKCDSKIKAFPDGFVVTSLSFDSIHSALPDITGKGKSIGPAQFGDVKVTKATDQCTPRLFLSMARGDVIPKVTISWTYAAPLAPLTWMTITLEDVQITSASYSDGLQESVAFSWSTITIKFVITKPDGSAGGTVQTTWNRVKNSSL